MQTPYPAKPGIYELKSGHQRFSLSIPEGFEKHSPSPLILALHYAGHGSPYYGKPMITELIEPALQELGAIILAPDCSAEDWTQPKSEHDVLALLDTLEATYKIDPKRRLVTGYSMGGMGTWHYAASHPDRFSAAIVMAGLPPENATEIEWQVPLYLLHSYQDELMPIAISLKTVEQLQKKGINIEVKTINDVSHYEVHRFATYLHSTIPWIQKVWA